MKMKYYLSLSPCVYIPFLILPHKPLYVEAHRLCHSAILASLYMFSHELTLAEEARPLHISTLSISHKHYVHAALHCITPNTPSIWAHSG